MVAWRGLSPGGSFGRAQVVINWAQDNWSHFDGWCCTRNIDPIDLPAYRFYNLALVVIKEDLTDPDPEVTEQQLANLEEVLKKCDETEHPLNRLGLNYKGNLVIKRQSTRVESKTEAAPETQQPSPESRHKYIPPWYMGEERAYKAAQAAMGGISTLPKMG
jgi:hypothetical protein